jgi:hypothetical protein
MRLRGWWFVVGEWVPTDGEGGKTRDAFIELVSRDRLEDAERIFTALSATDVDHTCYGIVLRPVWGARDDTDVSPAALALNLEHLADGRGMHRDDRERAVLHAAAAALRTLPTGTAPAAAQPLPLWERPEVREAFRAAVREVLEVNSRAVRDETLA